MNRELIQEAFRKQTKQPTMTLNKCEVGTNPEYVIWLEKRIIALSIPRVRQCATKLIIQITMKKEELIDFATFITERINYLQFMQVSPHNIVEGYLKSINQRSNETKAVRQNEQTQEVCVDCFKPKRLQGNGIIELLCECEIITTN